MIIQGDCLEEMKKLENDSIDLVCTDPPYGYSFMGKDWDKAVPSEEVWQECLRVLKPGAFCFVMSAPRSDVQAQMISRLTFAGFRVDFTPIYWTYASGFPKAGNIGKLVDKRLGVEREVTGKQKLQGTARRMKGGNFGDFSGDDTADEVNLTKATSDEAKALDGSYAGFQPKPAVEVVLVAMKPLSEKTFVDQALNNGKGVTWLDDARVPTGESLNGGAYAEEATERPDGKESWRYERGKSGDYEQPQGRFPANLLVSDDVLNDGRVSKSAVTVQPEFTSKDASGFQPNPKAVPGFNQHGDSGSYSRYFDIDKWWTERIKDLPESVRKTFPFLIVPKAGKREKNEGLEDREEAYSPTMNGGIGVKDARDVRKKNVHPTVKPLKLMSYLVTLGSRPGDTVLDPFVGSGTTALAAESLNRKSVGIEREQEYVEIAKARLTANKQAKLL